VPDITLLQLQRKSRDRVNVHLDGEYAFSLSLDLAAGLRNGQVLSEADIERLQRLDAVRSALDKASQLLARRPRSRSELRRRMLSAAMPVAAVEQALARLQEIGLVDDEAFARWWVANRSQHRPRGRIALRTELLQKGVDKDAIALALSEVDEAADARRLARQRAHGYRDLDDRQLEARLGGYLRRRGFPFEVVREALESARQALRESQSALDDEAGPGTATPS